jgi:hypothetical protein
MDHFAFIYKTVHISRQVTWNFHIFFPDERTAHTFQNDGRMGLRSHMLRYNITVLCTGKQWTGIKTYRWCNCYTSTRKNYGFLDKAPDIMTDINITFSLYICM